MRLGCAAYSYRNAIRSGTMSLEGFVDTCAELRLDGVEFTSYYFPDTAASTLHQLKQHCARRGMHILAAATRSVFTDPDPEGRAASVRNVREWLEHTARLGAPYLRVFAGEIHPHQTEANAHQLVTECLTECLPAAENCGVVLALENHGGITATAAQVQAILEAVPSPWLGVNLDFGNFATDPYEGFSLLLPRTVTTHAKVTMWGEPARIPVDYTRVRGILDAGGYQGYLSVEYEEPGDAMLEIPRFVEHLQQVFGTEGGNR